jgi:RNA polymerase-associated protein
MMNLYSGTTCPFSHRCRIVLYEKQMDFQVIDVDLFNKPEDIAVINPYNRVPVLVDRDLVLYESNIINEYIDERFPASAADAAGSPDSRQAHGNCCLHDGARAVQLHVDVLEKNLKSVPTSRGCTFATVWQSCRRCSSSRSILLGEDFSMLDVAIAPLLWRLDHYGIELPKVAAPLMKFAERIFSRQGFIDALTPSEKVMRR